MLVLKRKAKETIVIDNKITVCIERIEGSKVIVSVDAPEEISVHRGEVQSLVNLREEN